MTVFVPFQPQSRPVPGVLLGTLSLSAAQVADDAPAGTVIGSLLGKAPGSVVALVDAHSGAVALSGTDLVVGLSLPSAGEFQVTLRETLAGAMNSPRDTTLTIEVLPASEINPPQFDFSPVGDRVLALNTAIWTVSEVAGTLVPFDFAPAAERSAPIGSTIWTVT
ncbi:MAG: hypothetical protein DI527_07780 [Chelatococcus sp.]|nr:MAG: hypothetical protein DI527_07780 [Chelatococcus sp.]